MHILSLQLKNFRNHSNLNIDFSSRLVFIIGPNANGKTNIIEAISVLSLGKSFRGISDHNMIQDTGNFYNISCDFEKYNKINFLSIGCEINNNHITRKIKFNNKILTSRQKLIGHLVTITMSPDDLKIVEGGSTHRRKFLDLILSYENSDYYQDLLKFTRTLKHRNMLLKKIKVNNASRDDLKIWDKSFILYSMKLMEKRIIFIQEFKDYLYDAVEMISNSQEKYTFALSFIDENEIDHFSTCLESYQMRDIKSGFSNIGPQRHTLKFEINDKDILEFGSQGQKRTLVLALRIAQFYYLKKKMGISPLLLIDDVIRELDSFRQTAFIKLLKNCGQAIFTTPDLYGLEDIAKSENSKIYSIEKPGKVELQADFSDSDFRK